MGSVANTCLNMRIYDQSWDFGENYSKTSEIVLKHASEDVVTMKKRIEEEKSPRTTFDMDENKSGNVAKLERAERGFLHQGVQGYHGKVDIGDLVRHVGELEIMKHASEKAAEDDVGVIGKRKMEEVRDISYMLSIQPTFKKCSLKTRRMTLNMGELGIVEWENSEKDYFDKGSYGKVFIGKLLRPDRQVEKVAVKVNHVVTEAAKEHNEYLRQSLETEFKILQERQEGLKKHPNVVKLLGRKVVMQEEGKRGSNDIVCVVYQFEGNTNLKNLLKDVKEGKKELKKDQFFKLCRDLISAVNYIHNEMCVLHRDIKPSNVVVKTENDGTMKAVLVDFGVSRVFSDHGTDYEGSVKTTYGYIEPFIRKTMEEHGNKGDKKEVFSQVFVRKSDYYSLGETFKRMLDVCGWRKGKDEPFEDDDFNFFELFVEQLTHAERDMRPEDLNEFEMYVPSVGKKGKRKEKVLHMFSFDSLMKRYPNLPLQSKSSSDSPSSSPSKGSDSPLDCVLPSAVQRMIENMNYEGHCTAFICCLSHSEFLANKKYVKVEGRIQFHGRKRKLKRKGEKEMEPRQRKVKRNSYVKTYRTPHKSWLQGEQIVETERKTFNISNHLLFKYVFYANGRERFFKNYKQVDSVIPSIPNLKFFGGDYRAFSNKDLFGGNSKELFENDVKLRWRNCEEDDTLLAWSLGASLTMAERFERLIMRNLFITDAVKLLKTFDERRMRLFKAWMNDVANSLQKDFQKHSEKNEGFPSLVVYRGGVSSIDIVPQDCAIINDSLLACIVADGIEKVVYYVKRGLFDLIKVLCKYRKFEVKDKIEERVYSFCWKIEELDIIGIKDPRVEVEVVLCNTSTQTLSYVYQQYLGGCEAGIEWTLPDKESVPEIRKIPGSRSVYIHSIQCQMCEKRCSDLVILVCCSVVVCSGCGDRPEAKCPCCKSLIQELYPLSKIEIQ